MLEFINVIFELKLLDLTCQTGSLARFRHSPEMEFLRWLEMDHQFTTKSNYRRMCAVSLSYNLEHFLDLPGHKLQLYYTFPSPKVQRFQNIEIWLLEFHLWHPFQQQAGPPIKLHCWLDLSVYSILSGVMFDALSPIMVYNFLYWSKAAYVHQVLAYRIAVSIWRRIPHCGIRCCNTYICRTSGENSPLWPVRPPPPPPKVWES